VDWSGELAQTLQAVAVLDDPTRRSLYAAVHAAHRPITREEAAEVAGVSRKLAAFHLDKLVDAGLLVVADAGSSGRTGRPPKRYARSPRQLQLSIPERRPETLAAMFVDAVTSAAEGESPLEAALRAGRDAGRRFGVELRGQLRPGRVGAERALTFIRDALRQRGFEPVRSSGHSVRLMNCPFQPLAQNATEVVCAMNAQFMAGLIEGLGVDSAVTSELRPLPGQCCVELRGAAVVATDHQ
jgi:predicted ArsR family transcriptional regulator